MNRLSLLQKIWLSTSVALALLFGAIGWLLQRHMVSTTALTLEDEIRASFQGYEALWRQRLDALGSVAAILSSMPNVRAAFQTSHAPTIRDSAGELWLKVSDQLKETALFVVAEPDGRTLVPLDSSLPTALPKQWPMVKAARKLFPKQASGFSLMNGQLYQLVLTPVYIDTSQGPALAKVLVTGYLVNHLVAQRLKEATGGAQGSEFLFFSKDQTFASTLNERATGVLRQALSAAHPPTRVSDGVSEYAYVRRDLVDLEGQSAGQLGILRSFDLAQSRVSGLQRLMALGWLGAVLVGLGLSYFLARRIVQPIKLLDMAAAEVSRQNYGFRVPVGFPPFGDDELGRLGATFNSMCGSIQSARQELIRQERISTIGRMASSIVHDLRNPLAAIYGGAEMMVDTDLTPAQVKRVAANIYKSSRRIQEMLQDLLHTTRGNRGAKEPCVLAEVVEAGVETFQPAAAAQGVTIRREVDPEIELPLERARMERVVMNLVGNALDAMPAGGEIVIRSLKPATPDGDIELEIADNGPGIPPELRPQLFQPFATYGKKNGSGLGLALSRQAVLDHGGDVWAVDKPPPGAVFRIRLPRQPVAEPAATAI
ncbi:MAG: HAMP domain-containing histidine kinase [Bryobacterales bacterium]|nr:HAMP domain-containing histidine kinase [Bryobacterales bacterium]